MNQPGLLGTPDRRTLLCVLLFVCALYIPFAGNYGMWDPWETHYSEVARQMRMRGDYVSLYWPGSPQDRNEFWSKPVLTFWLMALGMAVAGLGAHGPAIPGHPEWARFDGEMAVGWTAEWAVRIPFILCAVLCIWAVFELVRRTAGRRPAIWSAIVLATSSQFFYVARQAMTDMAFVAPMAVALAMAGLALMLPASEVEAELPRRSAGGGKLSWPDAPAFYGLLAAATLLVLPQLILISIGVKLRFILGNRQITMAGIVPMLPYFAAFGLWLWRASRLRCKRQIYLHVAYLMCGVATLAKGPAGIAMPAIAILLFVLVTHDVRALLPVGGLGGPDGTEGTGSGARRAAGFALRFVTRHYLELGLGVLLFIAVTFPWYHAMLIRHGFGFWNEFIGDNYVHRAAGRHGDRGTFEYYILQIGAGMFPWVAVVAAGFIAGFARLAPRGEGDLRPRLRIFAMVWFLVMFATVSLVNTKFHHYILPALPALAILAGLLLDEIFTDPTPADGIALLLVGVPLLGLAGRDLALFPARLTWLFDYDYVNAPNGGRPYPTDPKYDYTSRVAMLVVASLLASTVLGVITLVRARFGERVTGAAAAGDEGLLGGRTGPLWAAVLTVVAVAGAALIQAPFGDGTPHPSDSGWIFVAVVTGVFLLLFLVEGLGDGARKTASVGLLVVGLMATTWCAWGLDRLLTDLSPHWAQKHVIAAYYKLRAGPDEPLIAWQMYWRGETFYTKNSIYDHRMQQSDKTVFLGDKNAEKLQTYFRTHGGRRVFFIVERSRFESLRQLLPESARPSLSAVDQTNNKVYLAVATLPPSEAAPAPDSKAAAAPLPNNPLR